MKELNQLDSLNELEIFLSSEQPVQCPYCGLRSNWLSDFSHTNSKISIHECNNHEYGFLFVVLDDDQANR